MASSSLAGEAAAEEAGRWRGGEGGRNCGQGSRLPRVGAGLRERERGLSSWESLPCQLQLLGTVPSPEELHRVLSLLHIML